MSVKKRANHKILTPQPLKGWRAVAYQRWKDGATVSAMAREYRAEIDTIHELIQRGNDRDRHEERERKLAVRGAPLVPLPPLEAKMAACRAFAAGKIDIGELSKRLRSQS